MEKSFMTIGGVQYRVEVNWNAISAYLVAIGRDTIEGLSTIDKIKPSDLSSMMVACINEGERLEGRECHLNTIDLGAIVTPSQIKDFMDIYIAQSAAQVKVKPAKKKDEPEEAV